MLPLINLEWKKYRVLLLTFYGCIIASGLMSHVNIENFFYSFLLGIISISIPIQIIIFLVSSFKSYQNDLNSYQGYFSFLLPYNGYQLIGSKIIFIILAFLTYGLLSWLNLILIQADSIFWEFFIVIKSVLSSPSITKSQDSLNLFLTVVMFGVIALVYYLIPMTSITLSRSLFRNKKIWVTRLLTIVLFLVVFLGSSRLIINGISAIRSAESTRFMAIIKLLYMSLGFHLVLASLLCGFSGYLLSKKINL